MKNFSDLLATELGLEVRVVVTPTSDTGDCCIKIGSKTVAPKGLTQQTRIKFQLPLLEAIDITVSGSVELVSLEIDRHHMWPKFCWRENETVRCRLDQPFYQWLHTVTGQGWLLVPAKFHTSLSSGLSNDLQQTP